MFDLSSWETPVVESSEIDQIGDTPIYVLSAYVDIEISSDWFSSDERRVLFTVKLDAKSGEILSLKKEREEQGDEHEDASKLGFMQGLFEGMLGV